MAYRKESVLVVDDDKRTQRLMTRILQLEGYRTMKAGDGDSALSAFEEEKPDVVLLDVMMPGTDGYTVCRRIREFSSTPIIMVSAKSDDVEKAEGLDAGADDYVTKPFSAVELAARVRAALRRSQTDLSEPAFCSGELVIDFSRQRVTLSGMEVELTATEYRLLTHLARNAGRVLTPDQILEKVWGEAYVGESNLLQVNMTRLRRKLGDDPKNPRFILTRPGIGYIMPRNE